MSWTGFAAVIAAFFLTHSLPVRPRIRNRIVGALGERGFTIGYSVLSLIMLSAVIAAAGYAPYLLLWPQAPWHRLVVVAGMLVVCLILAFSLGQPNPFSFGGAHHDRFDPQHPGIVRWLRHPVLVALALWASLHILPNGDLAHVILFGIFAGFAVLGRSLIDRRKKKYLTPERWQALQAQIKKSPLLPMPTDTRWVLARIAIALAAFVALLAAHPVIFGVPALSL